MVRFKVIKGSHLLLGIAVLIFAAALAFILLQGAAETAASPASGTEMIQNMNTEARAANALASVMVKPLEITVVPDSPAPTQFSGSSILIYHTHTHEAYQQVHDAPYEAVEAWRTEDENHSVVRLGAELAMELRKLGHHVIHDSTDHEQDSIDDAYVRSQKTLEGYDQEFDLCIDLHRDAYSEGLKSCLQTENSKEYAQLMLLVGRGDLFSGNERPNYESNLEFARQLTIALNRELPDICRNVTVKQGRYNQHIGQNSILVEIGHNQNTLAQAMASIPILANGIDQILRQNY